LGVSGYAQSAKRVLKMKKYAMIILLGLFFSCGAQHFSKKDYTFYDKDFRLPPNAVLRTDGVYVLESIWTDDNGGTTKKPDVHKFYRFYNTGQCNLILDVDNKISTPQHFAEAVKAASNRDKTLFEAYYKLKADKIIIEGVKAQPVKQFEYKYGYVVNNELVIVKATIDGKGKFDDKYFTDYYKEHYRFVHLDNLNDYPNW
jgi:hypothetical protein